MAHPEVIEQARAHVESAERIVVLTGAGISTDSGIPDFRGPNGTWTKNPDAEKMANIRYYLADPELRVRAWRRRIDFLSTTYEPNAGHHAIARLQQRRNVELLITQNVDGLHVAAGSPADRLVEIHGTNREVKCVDCGDRAPMEKAIERVRAGEADPPCRSCGGVLKSATVSFGENLVHEDLRRADDAARNCDLILAVGSTLSVYPIANVVPLAKSTGADVIILNGSPTEMDDLADVLLSGSISEVLPAVVDP